MALSNSQYNQIMRTYHRRQLSAYRDLKERQEKLYRGIPKLEELEQQVGRESLRAAEALMQGDRSLKADLKERISEISKEKQELLRAYGYPLDYMDIRYECKDCQDTGYAEGRKCHCFRAMELSLLYKQSNVKGIIERENFSRFDLSIFDNRERDARVGGSTIREHMQKLREYLEAWCENFPKDYKNLLILGDPGTGKTFFMNCITKAVLDRGYSVVYLTSTDFFETLGKSMRDRSGEEEESELTEAIMECDLLMIDDLGTEFSNTFTVSRLFYIINQRLQREKSTVISTNLNFKALQDEYSDRVVSRLMSDYEIIPLYGKDQRIR